MTSTNPRTKTLFDDGWTFHLGTDIAAPRRLVGKAGAANGWSDLTEEELDKYQAPRTDIEKMAPAFQAIQLRRHDTDATWTEVSLPYDWRIEQTPSPNHEFPSDFPKTWHASSPTGVAYYRKVFSIQALALGQHVNIIFDGIAGSSAVWLNGFWIGQQTTSYTPLTLDITGLLRFDISNVLLVRSDSTETEGWWLEGGGIYRHVWIESFGDVHIEQNGIYVTTPVVSQERATVEIEINGKSVGKRWTVVGHKAQHADGIVYEPGRIVVRGLPKGVAVAEHVEETAGVIAGVNLLPDRTVLSTSGKDVAILRISEVDVTGRFVPDAQNVVLVSATGAGRLAGLCNGDTAFSKDLRMVNETALFHGQAVAFIEAGEQEGDIEITVAGEGLQDGRTVISVSKVQSLRDAAVPTLDEREVSVYGTHRII
ncbi:galactose-binding domain-like protein [Aspergillus crustosus]